MNSTQKMILAYMMLNIDSKFEYLYDDTDTVSLIYYTGMDSDVVVPTTKSGVRVTEIESSCFNSNQNIYSITIPNGVVAIY